MFISNCNFFLPEKTPDCKIGQIAQNSSNCSKLVKLLKIGQIAQNWSNCSKLDQTFVKKLVKSLVTLKIIIKVEQHWPNRYGFGIRQKEQHQLSVRMLERCQLGGIKIVFKSYSNYSQKTATNITTQSVCLSVLPIYFFDKFQLFLSIFFFGTRKKI